MSDRMAAKITIGGAITAIAKDELDRLIDEEGPDEIETDEAGRLVVQVYEANWGELPTIEEFCRKHDLTYVRASESKYEINAEIVWWRPGMETPGICNANQSADPLLLLAEVAQRLDRPDELRAYVAERTPCEVPTLVVDGVPGVR